MASGFLRLPLDEIIIGERRREDMGDIAGLVKSIKKYGLIHPVVVDSTKHLVAGGRRLEACRELAWSQVDVRDLGSLTDEERFEIELEENEQRKDLTDLERSKRLVRKAQQVAPVISSKLDEKDSRGRKSTHGAPKEDIAQAIGVGKGTLIRAEQHVAAAERYPEIKAPGLNQRDALVIAKNLDALPEEERTEKREALKRFEPTAWAELAEKAPPIQPGDPDPAVHPKKDPAQRWHESLHKVWVIFNSTRDLGGILALTAKWKHQDKVAYLTEIQRMQQILRQWESELTEEINAQHVA